VSSVVTGSGPVGRNPWQMSVTGSRPLGRSLVFSVPTGSGPVGCNPGPTSAKGCALQVGDL
jgi:hypothetical protein